MENKRLGWDVVVMPRRRGGGQSCAFSPEPKLSWFFEEPQVLPEPLDDRGQLLLQE